MLLKGWEFAFNKKPWQSAVFAAIDKSCVWVTGQGFSVSVVCGQGLCQGGPAEFFQKH